MTITTPNTFIVGAGPVATALAGALRAGGVPVLGLWARRSAAARHASAISGVASYSAAPPDLLLEADVVILAVRDDAIAEVASMLVATGLITERHVMLHCSGVRASGDVLGHVRERLGGIGTMHPLEALADGRSGMRALARAVFGVEGDTRGEAVARVLVQAMGGTPLVLSGKQMAVYHAAAAMASNYLVSLMDAATSLLVRVGMSETDAISALMPLARGSLENIGEHGLARGLTGPIRRGDVATVGRHVDALASSDELATLYRALGLRTVALARRLGDTDNDDLDRIAELLRPAND